MLRSKTIIASLSLILLLSIGAFAQGPSSRAKASGSENPNAANNRKTGKYANQEISYRQTNAARTSGKSVFAPVEHTQTQLLPHIEQDNLKTARPKQQNLLPYLEQSNLYRRNASKRR